MAEHHGSVSSTSEELADLLRQLALALQWQAELGVSGLSIPAVSPSREGGFTPPDLGVSGLSISAAPPSREDGVTPPKRGVSGLPIPMVPPSKEGDFTPPKRVQREPMIAPEPARRLPPGPSKPPEPSPRPEEILTARDGPTMVVVLAGETSARVVDPSGELQLVREELGDCRRCKLSRHRRKIVFGEGNARARLVLVGEAPGADEDLQGRPFVGVAGQLLTKMIAAMGLTRDQVYICNVVKCRPEGNRDPEMDEIVACEPFLLQQLEVIRPTVILALGRIAAQTLLRVHTPISRLRGRWHQYHGIKLMPTYHPSYLLRQPQAKGDAWSDLKQVMAELGLAPPPPRTR